MSLATRCPACGTVFRVVQDQLRVSEGWVRCGHCQEVFNALESLFELSADAPLPAPSPPGSDSTAQPAGLTRQPPGPGVVATAPPSGPTGAPLAEHRPEPGTELDLSDAGDAGDAGDPDRSAPAPGEPQRGSPDIGAPFTAPFTAVAPPAPPPFDPLISVSSLLARPDIAGPAPAQPDAARLAALPDLPTPLPWPGPPVQADLLAAIAPAAQPAVADASSSDEDADADAQPVIAADDEPSGAPIRGHDEGIDFPTGPSPDAAAPGPDDDGSGPAGAPQRAWQRKRPRRPRAPATGFGGDAGETVGGTATRSHAEPAFLRRAARDARWQLPAVRAALIAGASLLGLLLLGQGLLHWRDGLAASWPGLRPSLAQACETLGCRIDAPRSLERISLDGSKLTSVAAETGSGALAEPADRPQGKVLRFAAELHNAARHSVRAPALELSFTDPLGQVVARRVLLPDELGLGGGTIAAGSTWQVDTRLAVGDLPVAGFSAEIFYP